MTAITGIIIAEEAIAMRVPRAGNVIADKTIMSAEPIGYYTRTYVLLYLILYKRGPPSLSDGVRTKGIKRNKP